MPGWLPGWFRGDCEDFSRVFARVSLRKWFGGLILPAILFALLVPAARAAPQETVQPPPPEDRATRTVRVTGDRLSGFVLPVEPRTGDITLRSLRARSWRVDDTQRLLLDKDVVITIAGYRFHAETAVVWLNRLPSADGVINQIAVYFEEVSDPTRRAGSGVAGRNILVTGSARGDVRLRAGLVEHGPTRPAIVRDGEARLRDHLLRLTVEPPALAGWPQVERDSALYDPEPFVPRPGVPFDPDRTVPLPDEVEVPVRPDPVPWLSAPGGSVQFSAPEIDFQSGEEENVTTLEGGILLDFVSGSAGAEWHRLSMVAQRAVIFSDPGRTEDLVAGRLGTEQLRGVYLEGNVIVRANEDEYVVRSPKIYYDFRRDQAVLVDGVLRTHARDGEITLYARAGEMRQQAVNEWTAERVTASTSEFFTPHISIGAQHMRIEQRENDATYLDARGVRLRAGRVPFFALPRFAGEAGDVPLRGIRIGQRDQDGLQIETTWDLYALMGEEPPDGLDIDLKVDGYTKRGAGLGLEFRYDYGATRGSLDLYGLYDDDGTDRTPAGRDVDPDRTFRGLALWEHQQRFGENWTFQGQGAWLSDETFIAHWRRDDFDERREYESSLYLKHQHDNAAFSILTKYEFNDFVSNSYLLASRQYQVEKLPELLYRRIGDSLFGDSLTYSSSFSVSRVRFAFHDRTPRETGIREGGFGIGADDKFEDQFLAAGFPNRWVNRADTRHEISLPTEIGSLKIVPFAVGRFTFWDTEFAEFAPEEEEKYRLFGSVGVTASTRLQRVDNRVNSRLLNLHRLRHIIEPSVTAWYGYSTISGTDLPIFDELTEPLSDGAAVRLGVRNTWQTQRGGPGRWRSVDVLTVDTNVVFTSNDTDRRSPTPQFFDAWPEYSHFGDHAEGSVIWNFSDHLAFLSRATYDLDEDVFARGAVGAELQHSPVLTTYVEYRTIEASKTEVLDVGWRYQLTPKYRIIFTPQWDFREDDFRAVRARVTRSFPDFDLVLFIRYDQIQDETTFGVTLGRVRF